MAANVQRTVIVTGANSGIGYETAAGLAEAGCHVIMACRSQGKAEQAKASLLKRIPGASLDVMLVDLGDPASVRTFATDFRSAYAQLDVLINNAGILSRTAEVNEAGIERQFATNHLGHFLLTALLIERVPDRPESRIVSLSSIAQRGATIDFDDLTHGGDGLKAYGQSKLACLLFADELDRRLRAAGRETKSLTVHPGGTDSGLFDEMSRVQYFLFKMLSPFIAQSNAKAARSSLRAALSSDIEGGDFYGPTGFQELRGAIGPARRNPVTQDRDVAQRLWTLSEDLTGQTFNP